MSRVHIVIADDDPAIRSLVIDALEEEGYTITAVGDGLSALTAVRAERPALAIFDIAMPVMTGDEALDALRREGPFVPVIVMTAGLNPGRFLVTGAFAALAKPFDLADLLAAIEAALSLSEHTGTTGK